jgi:hypothetical protein
MKRMDSLWTFEMMILYVCKQKMKNVNSKKYHSNIKKFKNKPS